MSGPVSTWMDLRCMEPAYKDDLVTALSSVITQGATILAEAVNNIDAYLEARERRMHRLEGKEVDVQIALYQDVINTLPGQLVRLNKIYNLVESTPSCESVAYKRVAERLRAETPRKGKGSVQWRSREYVEEAEEYEEGLDLAPSDLDSITWGD